MMDVYYDNGNSMADERNQDEGRRSLGNVETFHFHGTTQLEKEWNDGYERTTNAK